MEAAEQQGRGRELRLERLAGLVRAFVAVVGAVLLVGCEFAQQEPAIRPAEAYIDAKTTLLQSADDRAPATRSYAIEALARVVGAEAGATFAQALQDESPVVRFAAALAIGDVEYKPALPALRKMARKNTGERDKRVFCGIIYALYRLGNDEHAGELGRLLFDDEREVRMDAALAMGKMGEPSAKGPLKTILANEQDDGVRLQLTESLAMLGDSRSAEVIEAYTKGPFLDLRLAAIPALGRAGGTRAPRALKQLTHQRHPARVRVSAAGELARLGHFEREGYDLCVASVKDPQKVLEDAAKRSKKAADKDAASLKRLAILSLGWMNRQGAVNLLHPLLDSEDGGVRVAAALTVLRLLEAYRPVAVRPEAPATRPVAKSPQTRPAQKRPKLQRAPGKD